MTGGAHDPVALRLQRLDLQLQTLVLGQLAASRSEGGAFSPGAVTQLFHDFALPAPAKVANPLHCPDGPRSCSRSSRSGGPTR